MHIQYCPGCTLLRVRKYGTVALHGNLSLYILQMLHKIRYGDDISSVEVNDKVEV